MSSWGNYDNAANAPYWAVSSAIMNVTETEQQASAPTAANVALLYGNTSANVYTSRETIGLFMADKYEVAASGAIPSTGWVMKTEGQGGRAGRVQWEVLAVVSEVKNDTAATEDTTLPDAVITTSNPTGVSFVAGAGNNGTFSVTTSVDPASATLTYLWQVSADGGSSYASAANGVTANTTYVGNTTSAMTVYATNTDANTYLYRVQITATNPIANSNTSTTTANAQLILL
jgi:hypothetical protein